MTLTKTAIIRQKNDKVLMSTVDPANLFEKNLESTKARPAYREHRKLGPAVGKIKKGWKSRLQQQ
jgi:hypothetical protein